MSMLLQGFVRNRLVLTISLLSFGIGIVGIHYALPMHVIGDEESIIAGSLTMLQTRNFIPALQPNIFDLLYYPVLLPYLTLLAMMPVLIAKFAAGGFSVSALQDYFALNQSALWISARALVAVSGGALVFIVFRLGELLYNRRTAFWASLFLLTSFFHVSLTHWMKHWVPAALVAYGVFYLVARDVSARRNGSVRAGVLSGISVGISYVAGFGSAMAALYAWLNRSIFQNRFARYAVRNVIVAAVIGGSLISLYYQDFLNQSVREEGTAAVAKSLGDLVFLLVNAMRALLLQETALLAIAVLGLLVVRKFHHANSFVFGSVLLYFISMYLVVHFEPRYVYLIVPALALSAGSFIDWLYRQLRRPLALFFACLFIAYPAGVSFQYLHLLLAPDTRQVAVTWIQDHVKDDPFLLSSRSISLYRQPSVVQMVASYESLRAGERYELAHAERFASLTRDSYSYTNIHFWPSGTSLDTLNDYLDGFRPKYFIVEYWGLTDLSSEEYSLIAGSTLVASIRQSSAGDPIDVNGNFYTPSTAVFSLDRLGPNVDVYRL